MTFYEQVGIVIPGSVLVVGLLFYFPELNTLVAKDGVTLGRFGIFLLLSYAAGHLAWPAPSKLSRGLWAAFVPACTASLARPAADAGSSMHFQRPCAEPGHCPPW
jgi:hypothetical protein